MEGLNSLIDEEKAKAADKPVQYMKERMKVLSSSITIEKLQISKLRTALFKSKTFSMLM